MNTFAPFLSTFEIFDNHACGQRSLNKNKLEILKLNGWEIKESGTVLRKQFYGELQAEHEFKKLTGLSMDYSPCKCCGFAFTLSKL